MNEIIEDSSTIAESETPSDVKANQYLIKIEVESTGKQASDMIRKSNTVDGLAPVEAEVDSCDQADNANNESVEAARLWFQTLTDIEKSAALGFLDSGFISTIKAVLSSSSSVEQVEKIAAPSLDWTTKIDINETYKQYNSYLEMIDCNHSAYKVEEAILLENGLIEKDVSVTNKERRNIGDTEAQLQHIPPAKNIRIHSKIDTDPAVIYTEEVVQINSSIFDHCFAIFPSAFEIVSGHKIDDIVPFVTLEFTETSDRLFLLDQAFFEYFGSPFLSSYDDMALAISSSWLQRLQRNDDETKVPLAAVLLARFEHAALATFVDKNQINSKPELLRLDGDQYASQNMLENTGSSLILDGGDSDMDTTEPIPSLSLLLSDVFSHARAMDDVSMVFDTSTVDFIEKNFAKVFPLGAQHLCAANPRFLSATPLKFVLFGESSPINYEAINYAIATSLLRIHRNGPSSLGKENLTKESSDNVGILLIKESPESRVDATKLSSQEVSGEATSSLGVDVVGEDDVVHSGTELESSLNHQHQSSPGKTTKKKKKKSKKKKVSIATVVGFQEQKQFGTNLCLQNRKPASNSKDSFSPQRHATENGLLEVCADHDSGKVEAPKEIIRDVDPCGEEIQLDDEYRMSFDSADSEVSEKESVKSDVSLEDKNLKIEKEDSIALSRFDGKIIVAPAVSGGTTFATDAEKDGNEFSKDNNVDETDDGDEWETVEAKSKSNRRKAADKPSSSKNTLNAISSSLSFLDGHGANGRSAKVNKSPASRRKSATRKIVKDTVPLTSVKLEEDVPKKKGAAPQTGTSTSTVARSVVNPWNNGPPGKTQLTQIESLEKASDLQKKAVEIAKQVTETSRKAMETSTTLQATSIKSAEAQKKVGEASQKALETSKKVVEATAKSSGTLKPEKTLRDVLLGTHLTTSRPEALAVETKTKNVEKSSRATAAEKDHKNNSSTDQDATPPRHRKGIAGTADQNTAPTYQETVSAVSATSNAVPDSKEKTINTAERLHKSDSSSGETDEVPPNIVHKPSISECNEKDTTPPLPTLLSPENANSSTSSVASSLEAPRAVHPHHHSKSAPSTSDVGYHLLDVCDKLSRDMNLFMSRRALALSPRRQERSALLAALQESVSLLWPGRCHAELYGSCAIQLDLPSSDLDVVVVGLHRHPDVVLNQGLQLQSSTGTKSFTNDSVSASASQDEHSLPEEDQSVNHQMPFLQVNPYLVMHSQLNSERVMLLAAELERQPWAVQVKAIPTASVPVVKILADPSRLVGHSYGGDWMYCQPVSPPVAVGPVPGNEFNAAPSFLPWRGSDIVKGLLALDITFEGPEHGGIGSTEFSSRVIAEACLESGLHPEATPLVQVLLVLKELLAQRKLNEPYSGGLSSYALLLLVLAVLRERSVIREEIERVECQRRAMASVDAESFRVDPTSTTNTIRDGPNPGVQCSARGSAVTEASSSVKSLDPTDSSRKMAMEKSQATPSTKSPHKSDTSIALTTTKVQVTNSSWANVAKKASGAMAAEVPKHITQQPKLPATLQSSKPQPINETVSAKQKPSFADAVAGTLTLKPNSTNEQPSVQYQKKKLASEKGSGPVVEIKKFSSRIDTTSDGVSTIGARNYSKESVKSTSDVSKLDVTNSTSKTENSLSTEPTDNKQSISGTLNRENPSKPTIPSSTTTFYPKQNEKVMTSASTTTTDDSVNGLHAFYPQGVNDIIEVLCAGEQTAGKILMHFLLFYGQYFDAQTTAIDISGKHSREQVLSSQHVSPFIQRRAPGSIDPVTGMLIVDPIVVYDPLEGAENNNVARRCFAWNSVRWIFAQSYATLSSAVERSATPPSSPVGKQQYLQGTGTNTGESTDGGFVSSDPLAGAASTSGTGDPWDPSSPLLSCLLSF